MEPRFFRNPAELRAWFERNGATQRELWMGFYKVASGKKGVAYKEALDEALCFGWIDGVRKSLDEHSYVNRFSPRTARSPWSRVNIARAEELRAEGRMRPAGLAAFDGRDRSRDAPYSFDNELRHLAPAYEKRFRRNRAGWRFWEAQPPGYRRAASWWVMSAKREDTRLRRLATLIADSAAGRRVAVLTPPSKRP